MEAWTRPKARLREADPAPSFVGGIAICVRSQDPGLNLEVSGTAVYSVAPNAEAEVALQVTVDEFSTSTSGAVIFDSASLWKVSRLEQEFVFEFTSPRFGRLPYERARFRPDFTGGTITMQRDYFAGPSVNALEYPLDELLMMNLLAQGRGVELHACTVRDCNGRGYLFLGQSGAGKTTTARLWQNLSRIEISSDDRVMRRKGQ